MVGIPPSIANPVEDVTDLPWRDMESAPRDGTIIAVCYHEWNDKRNPLRIQAAQWLISSGGCSYAFRTPFDCNSTVYAEGWLTIDEINVMLKSKLEGNDDASIGSCSRRFGGDD